MQVIEDFREEVAALHGFLETLAPADWERETAFKRWTPWDVVAHLHYFDLESRVSLQGEEAFAPHRKEVFDAIAAGTPFKVVGRERFGGTPASDLLAAWRESAFALADELAQTDPKQRLPWYGPDMGIGMFTTARYMETWAHGQEVYDLVGATRSYDDRIRNIATIGVKTFGWTFVNRRLDVPGDPPHVRLVSPSGEVWEWNEDNADSFVGGDAAEFCHVVTQGRNVADTKLEVRGDVAERWMAIAQCFAGGPEDPPAPGTRGPAAA